MTGQDLVMELTAEQGPGRETQVQPPVDVWIAYFVIDLADPPQLNLLNARRVGAQHEMRPVVEHDHNWTVEVSGASPPRPAIIRFSRTGLGAYTYWVFTPEDVEYGHCRWMLDTFPNPHWRRGRRWLVV